MEVRLYAEDPANGFLPSIGKLEHFVMPEGIRVDTGVEQGGEVSQFYDPMIAKLIVHADTRDAAVAALANATRAVEVWPVRTNAGFLGRCLTHPRFVAGDVDTGFIGAEEQGLVSKPMASEGLLQAAALRIRRGDGTSDTGPERHSPWDPFAGPAGFRANAVPRLQQVIHVNGERTPVQIDQASMAGHATAHHVLDAYSAVHFEGGDTFIVSNRMETQSGGTASDGSLRAPMPGKIVAAPAAVGAFVTKGQAIVVLEAMKMEHALVAPFDGKVAEVKVTVGDQVSADSVLAVVEPAQA
jgi:acetyl/propionyl-CoA carboxylase alpha subunit